VTLQHHRPDRTGTGLERKMVDERDHRTQLHSPRWGAALSGGRLPRLANPEMNPTPVALAVLFWAGLGFGTFVVLLLGYGSGFWH
jgi:hypothetical protein